MTYCRYTNLKLSFFKQQFKFLIFKIYNIDYFFRKEYNDGINLDLICLDIGF